MPDKEYREMNRERFAAMDFFGKAYERDYPGSKYDANTGLLDYSESKELMDLLDPEGEQDDHLLPMWAMVD